MGESRPRETRKGFVYLTAQRRKAGNLQWHVTIYLNIHLPDFPFRAFLGNHAKLAAGDASFVAPKTLTPRRSSTDHLLSGPLLARIQIPGQHRHSEIAKHLRYGRVMVEFSRVYRRGLLSALGCSTSASQRRLRPV